MNEYLKKYRFDETPVHDCHYHVDRHYKLSDSIKYLQMNREYLGMDKIVLLCFTEDSMQVDPYENIRGLYFLVTASTPLPAFITILMNVTRKNIT